MRLASWLLRYPVSSHFALACGISWSGILIAMSATDIKLLALRPLDAGLLFAFMLLGPSNSGLALTAAR
jgi:hypothetical protein